MSTERLKALGFAAAAGTLERRWVGDPVLGEVTLPAILISGSTPGPLTLVTAGLHGDEYDGLEAALRLAEETDPARLTGSVLIIPRVHVAAFRHGWRTNDIDGLDLNRQFPGRKEGYLSQRLAWFVTEKLLPVADLAIDLHGGNTQLAVVSYGCVRAPEDIKGEMQRLLTVRHLWDFSTNPTMRGTLLDAAEDQGVPIAILEIGGGNTWSEEPVGDALAGMRNLLRWKGQIGGDYERLPDKQLMLGGSFGNASASGFLRPRTHLGDWVKEGQVLATIVDLTGVVLEEVTSKVDGVVNDIRTMPSIQVGEWLYLVGEVLEEIRYDA
ncbi:MAG: succinylglutamate desuccinylase/aspartoacylase family protein [Azospirillaceae bacterium]